MSEIGRLIRAIRRSVRVRERTEVVGAVDYCCDRCLMRVRVLVARGVSLPSRHGVDDLRAPAPRSLSCGMCEGEMRIEEQTYEQVESDPVAPYLRVPSRSAGAEMAARGAVEAQLVEE